MESYHETCWDCRRSTSDSRTHPLVHAPGCPHTLHPYGTINRRDPVLPEPPDSQLQEAKRTLLAGKYRPLAVATLEQLTEQAWGPQGSFSMRLLAGEVWRLRKAVVALEDELATHANRTPFK